MKFELRGYDRFDCEYYEIGVFDTYEEAIAAKKKYEEELKLNHNDDSVELRAI